MANLKYLGLIPGSASLFVLLQFLTETFAEDPGGLLKISNLRMLFFVTPSPGSDLRQVQVDMQQQFMVLLLVTLVLLLPPVIWIIADAIKSSKQK